VNRVIPTALCVGIVLITFLSLRAGFQAIFPVERSSQAPKIDNSVVALADGSVMIARPGTISRNVIDWFNDKSAPPRQFDIGPQPFVPNSDLPEPEAKVRLARLATELKAYPAVNAEIIVCSAANASARRLAASRAYRLKQELAAKQIETDRISAETCLARAAQGAAPPAPEQDEQVVRIALSRD
jgi:hypothetical protein